MIPITKGFFVQKGFIKYRRLPARQYNLRVIQGLEFTECQLHHSLYALRVDVLAIILQPYLFRWPLNSLKCITGHLNFKLTCKYLSLNYRLNTYRNGVPMYEKNAKYLAFIL